MQQLGFAALTLAALSGCAVIANLDDYAAQASAEAPDAGGDGRARDAANDAAPDASGADGPAPEGAAAFDCSPSPDVLACSDLATGWPDATCVADVGNSIAFASDALVVQIPAADGAYCERAVVRTLDALTYAVDVFVDARSTSPAAYADVASLVFDVDYTLAVSITGGHWGLDWGHEGRWLHADLGAPVTTRAWVHVVLTMSLSHVVTVSFDGVPASPVALTPAPTELQGIDVGPRSAENGPFLLRMRNLRVTVP